MSEKKTNQIDSLFPFSSDYFTLLKGETISKRGAWWTAVLLVETVVEEGSETKPQRKVLLQRWRKRGDNWQRKKEFPITKPKHWKIMEETLKEWIEEKEWTD